MTHYTTITIIYNPNSTGTSERLAKDTATKLQAALPDETIQTVATEYAGHAEELAYGLAKASARPLIISASGDGGYNEVINGALQAKQAGAMPTTGLLPAGNANDHFSALHSGDFVDAVVNCREQAIDVLKIASRSSTGPLTRYAHSYIGLGLTPEVGHELNKTRLNRIKEAWITGKSFLTFEHVKIKVHGKTHSYHSLIFSNIGRMAKVITLAKRAVVDDGLFEVSILPRKSKFHFVVSLLKASTQGDFNTTQAKTYSFQTVQRTLVQLDGEIITINPGTQVKVGLGHKALRCIV